MHIGGSYYVACNMHRICQVLNGQFIFGQSFMQIVYNYGNEDIDKTNNSFFNRELLLD